MWVFPTQLMSQTKTNPLDINQTSQVCSEKLLVRSKLIRVSAWRKKLSSCNTFNNLLDRLPPLGFVYKTQKRPTLCSLQSQPTKAFEALPLFSSVRVVDIQKFRSTNERDWAVLCERMRDAHIRRNRKEQDVDTLLEHNQWRTPTLCEPKRSAYKDTLKILAIEQVGQKSILGQIIEDSMLWLTPNATDGERDPFQLDYALRRVEQGRQLSLQGQISLNMQVSKPLNPRWVEVLMGLPIGWVLPTRTQ